MAVVNLLLPRDVYWRIAQFIRIFDFNGIGRLGTTEVRLQTPAAAMAACWAAAKRRCCCCQRCCPGWRRS